MDFVVIQNPFFNFRYLITAHEPQADNTQSIKNICRTAQKYEFS